ncbi:MAG: hypothetical protein JXA20_15760 [Spirochaetes bacterium]|nr:hypothetical protein [Spirochaetota bacterium]
MNLGVQRILVPVAVTLSLAPLFITVRGGAGEGELSAARENYYRLEGLYRKWDEGLFGSRNYRYRELEAFLASIIGSEIETDHDCIVDASSGWGDGSVRCSIGWLTLRGPLEEESLKEVLSDRPQLLTSWWRSGVLVSARGRLRRFGIDRMHRHGGIVLYLERIAVRANNGGAATKKN